MQDFVASMSATRERVVIIKEHIQRLARAESEGGKREQIVEQAFYWQIFVRSSAPRCWTRRAGLLRLVHHT
jgi:hypothetical protein